MSSVNPESVAAIERLIYLINASEEKATEQVAEFRAMLADPDEDEEIEESSDLMWLLKDVMDWDSGYFVDWKDTESLIDSIDVLCETRNVSVDWGTDDPGSEEFLDNTDVPSLMQQAHASLATQGYTLWNWDTQGDCYSGWITRSQDDGEVQAISEQLDVEFRPGDNPF